MSLRSFLEAVGPPDHAIAVVGGEAGGPLEGMLAETFAESSIEVVPDPDAGADSGTGLDGRAAVAIESEEPIDPEEHVAVLLENGEPVAASPMGPCTTRCSRSTPTCSPPARAASATSTSPPCSRASKASGCGCAATRWPTRRSCC